MEYEMANTGSVTHPEMVAYSGLALRTGITFFKSLNNFLDSSCLSGLIPAAVGNFGKEKSLANK